MLSGYCQLPYHVIFTSLAAWTEDKGTGATYRTPALAGKLAHECPAYFDLVLHMEAHTTPGDSGKSSRVWRTFPDERILAKDASGSLEGFEPADWMGVFSKIIGNGKKTKGGAK